MEQKYDTSGNLNQSFEIGHLSRYFFIFCFAVALYCISLILQPFLSIIIFSTVIAVSFAPIHRFALRVFHNADLAAGISCCIVLFIISLPLFILALVLWSELVILYHAIEPTLRPENLDIFFRWTPGSTLYDAYHHLTSGLPIPTFDLSSKIMTFAQEMSDSLIQQIQAIFAHFLYVIFGFIIMFFILFHFFRDGKDILQKAMYLCPLSMKYKETLVSRIRSLMTVTFYGVILFAVVQGILGAIGFAMIGLNQVLLWGTLIAFSSLIPYIGVALIWVPVAVVLYLSGDHGHAIFLSLWSIFIIASADAFLRPVFIGEQIDMHPMLMFFVVCGGILVYGPVGIIIGPMLLIVVTTLF